MSESATEFNIDYLEKIYAGRLVQPADRHKAAVKTVVQKATAGSTTGVPNVVLITGAPTVPVVVDISRAMMSVQWEGSSRYLSSPGSNLVDNGVRHILVGSLYGRGLQTLTRFAKDRELKVVLNNDRTRNLINEHHPVLAKIPAARNFIEKLVRYAKCDALTGTAIKPENLLTIARFYGLFITIVEEQAADIFTGFIDCPDKDVESVTAYLTKQCAEAAAQVLQVGQMVPSEGEWIIAPDDYTYLPVALGLPCAQYDLLVVDAAETLPLVARKLAIKCVRPTGTLVMLGDKESGVDHQRGVRNGVFQDMLKLPGAVECKLDVSDSNKKSLKTRTCLSLSDVLDRIDEISDGKGKSHISSFKTRFLAYYERWFAQASRETGFPWRVEEATAFRSIVETALESCGKMARVGTLVEKVKEQMGEGK